MLSNTGYGSTGPWREFKAQGTTLEATMGLMAVTGYAGGAPARAGQSVPDFFACWTGLIAILAALVERQRSGLGQWIDLGMYQLGPAMIPEALLHRQAHGRDPERVGARDAGVPISGVHRCADGGWLAVSTGDHGAVAALAGAGGLRGVGGRAQRRPTRRPRSRPPGSPPATCATPPTWRPPRTCSPAASTSRSRSPGPRPAGAGDRTAVPLVVGGQRGRRRRPGARASARATRTCSSSSCGLPDAEIAELYARGIVTDAPAGAPPARAMDVAALLASGVLTRIDDRAEVAA